MMVRNFSLLLILFPPISIAATDAECLKHLV